MRSTRRTRFIAAALAVAGTSAITGVAVANHGALDPFFGNQGPGVFIPGIGQVGGGGVSIENPTANAEQAQDILALPDGKMIVAGTAGGFAIARYRSVGRLDPTFSTDGVVTRSTAAGARANALATGNALPILAAGKAPNPRIPQLPAPGSTTVPKAAIVHGFTETGAPASGWGQGGQVVISPDLALDTVALALAADAPPPASPTQPALQPLVAVGGFVGSDTPAGDKRAFVARLTREGASVTGFGGTGVVTLDRLQPPNSQDQVRDLAFTGPNRSILAVGSTQVPGSNGLGFVVKLTPQGALDPAFGGGDGVVVGPFGCGTPGAVSLNSVLIDPAGRIVAAGSCGGLKEALVTRLLPDGSPDTSFAIDGTVTSRGPNSELSAMDGLLRQPDGTLVSAGSVVRDGKRTFAIMALTDAGNPKPDFGTLGFVVTSPGGTGVSEAKAITTVSDGNLVAAGRVQKDGENFMLVKYHAARDRGAPRGGVTLLSPGLDAVRRAGAFRLRITSSEPTSASVTIRLGTRVIARGEVPITQVRRRTVAVRLTAAGRALLAGRTTARVAVSVSIEDVADKRATLRIGATLR